jgi:hypothetical protein
MAAGVSINPRQAMTVKITRVFLAIIIDSPPHLFKADRCAENPIALLCTAPSPPECWQSLSVLTTIFTAPLVNPSYFLHFC